MLSSRNAAGTVQGEQGLPGALLGAVPPIPHHPLLSQAPAGRVKLPRCPRCAHKQEEGCRRSR